MSYIEWKSGWCNVNSSYKGLSGTTWLTSAIGPMACLHEKKTLLVAAVQSERELTVHVACIPESWPRMVGIDPFQ